MGSEAPAFVPQWLRGGKGDDNGVGLSLRNRPWSIDSDSNRSSSVRNGFLISENSSSSSSQAYSNFGRRDRRNNTDSRDTRYSNFGSRDSRDSLKESRIDRETSWRSRSLDSGSNSAGASTASSTGNGIRRSYSIKRDFPTLPGIETKSVLDTGRVSSVTQSLRYRNSNKAGDENWTSPLAEAPVVVGSNASTNLTRSKSAGLNMAEALIQAPSRARTPPQLSVTSRAEELTIRQCKQLTPLTPPMPKYCGLNSLERPKIRGTPRGGHVGGSSKSVQPANGRSEALKASSSQTGNFHILTREKTIIIPPTVSKDVSSQDVSSSKSSINPNLNKASKPSSSSFGDKRLDSRGRQDFFNSIRKKSTVEKSLPLEENGTANVDASVLNQEKNSNGDGADVSCVVEKELQESFVSQSFGDDDGENEQCHLTERDKAFLVSLGWKEDAVEEALTAEEIAGFINKYSVLRPHSKFSERFEAASVRRAHSKFSQRFEAASVSLAQTS